MPEQRWIRGSLVWIVLIVAVLAMWATFVGNDGAPTVRSIGQVAQEVRDGKVQQLVQAEGSREVQVKYRQEAGLRNAVTTIPAETDLLSVLENYGINAADLPPGLLEFEPASRWGAWLGALTFILPTLFLIGIFVFMMRQAQGIEQPGDVVRQEPRPPLHRQPADCDLLPTSPASKRPRKSWSKSSSSSSTRRSSRRSARAFRAACCWSDRRAPARRCSRGRSPARPGCRSSASPAPSSSRCSSASAPAACAISSTRPSGTRRASSSSTRSTPSAASAAPGLGGSHDEREQTLNQILVEMDGFDSSTNVIVIAATNRPDVLDPALLRPGPLRPPGDPRPARYPGPAWRSSRSTSRGKPLEEDVSIEDLARQTPGFSGADLENLVNEAAILAARRNNARRSAATR